VYSHEQFPFHVHVHEKRALKYLTRIREEPGNDKTKRLPFSLPMNCTSLSATSEGSLI
jgi:hypothetical protein